MASILYRLGLAIWSCGVLALFATGQVHVPDWFTPVIVVVSVLFIAALGAKLAEARQ